MLHVVAANRTAITTMSIRKMTRTSARSLPHVHITNMKKSLLTQSHTRHTAPRSLSRRSDITPHPTHIHTHTNTHTNKHKLRTQTQNKRTTSFHDSSDVPDEQASAERSHHKRFVHRPSRTYTALSCSLPELDYTTQRQRPPSSEQLYPKTSSTQVIQPSHIDRDDRTSHFGTHQSPVNNLSQIDSPIYTKRPPPTSFSTRQFRCQISGQCQIATKKKT